jgi:hypothetical protein
MCKTSIRTSQETQYVCTTKTYLLILFKETVAVYYENHMEHTNTLCGQNAELCNIYKFSSYLIGNTSRLRYRDQPLNAVKETVAVYCENHTKHKNTMFSNVKADGA